MVVAVDILSALILITAGYVYACYYLSGFDIKDFNTKALKLTKNRFFYLLSAVISVGVLIVFFEYKYFLELIPQVKLLSLVLIIFPVAAVDFRIKKIPNKLLIAAVVIRIILYAVEFITYGAEAAGILKDNLTGAVIIGGFFLILLFVFKNSIGMGDIKLFAIMGLYQGLWGAVNSVFFSLMVSFFVSVPLLITKKKGRKDTIAFGPSVLLGTIIAIGLAGM